MIRFTLIAMLGFIGAASIVQSREETTHQRSPSDDNSESKPTAQQDESPGLTADPLLLDITKDQVQTIDLLLDVTSSSVEKGTVLGVHVRKPSTTLRSHLRIAEGMGLVVEHVVTSSAADDAGIEVDDVLLTLDDQELVNHEQLTTLIRNRQPGELVLLTLMRQGEKETTRVELKEGNADLTESVDPELSHWLLEAHPQIQLDRSFSHKQHLDVNCKSCHVGPTQMLDRNLKEQSPR